MYFLGVVTAVTCPPNPYPCVRRMYPNKTHLLFGGPQKLSVTFTFCNVSRIDHNIYTYQACKNSTYQPYIPQALNKYHCIVVKPNIVL